VIIRSLEVTFPVRGKSSCMGRWTVTVVMSEVAGFAVEVPGNTKNAKRNMYKISIMNIFRFIRSICLSHIPKN
jgi:hypothetical protein